MFFRRFEESRVSRISRKFCGIHYVPIDGQDSGASTLTGYLYSIHFLIACIAAEQRADKSELLVRTK